MKIKVSVKMVIVLALLIMPCFAIRSIAQQKFEKAAFYNVMSTGNVEAIDNEIAVVESSSSPNKEGYEGALLMKKAGLGGTPKKKLAFFKEGRIKLETAIMADDNNTEFHFLRLAIEEHAPKIVKYHNDIDKDKLMVTKNFKSLSPAVQKAILDYSKNSRVLHAEDF